MWPNGWVTAMTQVIETYAHVTPRMRSAAVSKVRAFLGADPGARPGAVVRPPVGIGGGAFREPPVSPLEDLQGRVAEEELDPNTKRLSGARDSNPGPHGPEECGQAYGAGREVLRHVVARGRVNDGVSGRVRVGTVFSASSVTYL
jgi:hypothetical protein